MHPFLSLPAALVVQGRGNSLAEAVNPWFVLIIVAILAFAISIGVLLVVRYKRCPSNRVLVVYGKVGSGQSAKCVHGGGTFVWPLIQAYDYLNLEPIQIEVPLRGALSAENIRVNVPSYFTVAIGTQPQIMQNASIRLLGLSTDAIKNQALDIIFGQLRQVIASMTIEGINRDRDHFLKSVQTSLEPELEKIGLVLINVNITDITDESGYIEALGRKAASEAVQKAEVDVAEQVKRGRIGVAGAERDREVEVAAATKVREIGVKDAEREMSVRVAELARDRAVGEQRAAYDQEIQVREADRQKRVQVAKANAEAVTGENLAQATIASSEAELKVRRAEAYAVGETKTREAEAAVQAAQYRALAIAAEAKAKQIEAEQRAQLEAPAKAQKARIMVDAEALAEKTRIEAQGRAAAQVVEAEAQAKAIFLKLEAEARGQYEILAKKGEGLQRLVEGCGGAEAAFQLLMLEHLDHLAETASKAISNIKFDKVTVWDSGGTGGGTSGFLSSLGKSIPPLLDVMKNIGGVEMPAYLGKLTDPTTGTPPAGDKPKD
ncbi:MAG: flotillin family protein [Planctomycetes bacterium]|nr:flotillin family protein [Planctomycetota bacterium]